MDYIAEIRDLVAQQDDLQDRITLLKDRITLRLRAGRAAGIPVEDLASAAGLRTRQTVYNRLGPDRLMYGAARAVVMVDGARDVVAGVLSRELGRSVEPTPADRLGWEVVVEVAEAVVAVEALQAQGLRVELNFEK